MNTHFIDQHKKGIDEEMANVIEEDREYVDRMKTVFTSNKKIAAITAALGSHQAALISKK